MRICINSGWLLFFLINTTCFLLISEGKGGEGRRGDSSRNAIIVDYYPHPHREEGAITPPHQVEGSITLPHPHQEERSITYPHEVEGAITQTPPHQIEGTITHPPSHQEEEANSTKVETPVAEQKPGSHNAGQTYPGEIPSLYSGEGISGENYPRRSGMHYEKYFQSGNAIYGKQPVYFYLVGSKRPKGRHYPTDTLRSKLRPSQSGRGLETETNMHSEPEKKKRPQKPRKKRSKKNRNKRPKKNRTSSYGMESVTNAADVSTHSSEATARKTAEITPESSKRQP